MRVSTQSNTPVRSSEVEQPISAEKPKNKEIQTQSETSKASKQSSQAEAAAKKAEMQMTGGAQAAAIRWKMDEGGSLWSVLQRGSSGTQVKELQQRLNESRERAGLPPIKVDGKFGKETEEAVLAFQDRAVKNGTLDKADGIAGPLTESLLGVSPRYRVGSKGKSVEALQDHLNLVRNAQGLPPIKVDGVYGKETEDAVRDFQRNSEITSDGIIGPETRNALPSAVADIVSKTKAHEAAAEDAKAQMAMAQAAENEAEATRAAAEDLTKALEYQTNKTE